MRIGALLAAVLLWMGCSHSSPLLGKWKASDFPMEVEFLQDGSYRRTLPVANMTLTETGRWTLEKGVLKCTNRQFDKARNGTDSVAIPNDLAESCSVNGDQMTLTRTRRCRAPGPSPSRGSERFVRLRAIGSSTWRLATSPHSR